MKFQIQFKDPDGVFEGVQHAANTHVRGISGLDADEREVLSETHREKLDKAIEKWVDFGEYITIEFDTEAGTATVVKR